MKRAVVDQPGFKITVFGLIISIMLGLIIKAQISPKKIKSQFDEAIQRLEPDVRIDFKTAEIKLSDWGWPQPYLEVHDIRLSPVKTVCAESQIYIETLFFPITFNLLFESKKIIQSLRMTQLEIRLSEFKNCFSNLESGSEPALNQSLMQIFSAPTAGQLQELKVDRIKILSKNNFEMPIYLQAALFQFTYLNQNLSQINLKSQMLSYKNQQKQNFNLKSDLVLQISKKSNQYIDIQGQFKGRLVDRDYSLDFNYNSTKNEMVFKAKTQKILLKPLFQFLDFESDLALKRIKNDLVGFNLTTDFMGSYSMTENIFKDLEFKDFKIESESTQITADSIEVTSLRPFKIRPSKLEIINLDLKNILTEKIKNKMLLKNLVNAGKLSGRIDISEDQNYKFEGQIKDIVYQFEFGEAKVSERINSVDIHIKGDMSDSNLIFQLENFFLNERPIIGTINYKISNNTSDEYDVNLKGELLSQTSNDAILGSEQKVVWNLNAKQNQLYSVEELSAEKLTYFELELLGFSYTSKSETKSESQKKTKAISLQIKNVEWPMEFLKSSNDLVQFYIKEISSKNLALDGVYTLDTDQYIFSARNNKSLRNKRIEINLKNKQYEIHNL